jgi:hypothetical protein
MLDTYLAYASTLKMEATCSSETLLDFQQAIWRYIPEDITLHNHRCENLKSNKNYYLCIVRLYTSALVTSQSVLYMA